MRGGGARLEDGDDLADAGDFRGVARLEEVLQRRLHEVQRQLGVVGEVDADGDRPLAGRHPQLLLQKPDEAVQPLLVGGLLEEVRPEEVLQPQQRRPVQGPVLDEVGLADEVDEVVTP